MLYAYYIELSSAADYGQMPRFLTGLHSWFKTASKATAPTICYLAPGSWLLAVGGIVDGSA